MVDVNTIQEINKLFHSIKVQLSSLKKQNFFKISLDRKFWKISLQNVLKLNQSPKVKKKFYLRPGQEFYDLKKLEYQ